VRNTLGGPKRRIIANIWLMHEARSTAPNGTERALIAMSGSTFFSHARVFF
jgi:hypothetical protein